MSITIIKCPKCGSSDHLIGLYRAFWADLTPEGDDAKVNFSDHVSSTELGEEVQCTACEIEFHRGDDVWEVVNG